MSTSHDASDDTNVPSTTPGEAQISDQMPPWTFASVGTTPLLYQPVTTISASSWSAGMMPQPNAGLHMPAAAAGLPQPHGWNALALMYAMQQQSPQIYQQMMDMMRALQLNTSTRENRMLVTKTHGTSEDPKTWMKNYGMACVINRWLTDKQKNTHLKQAFIPGSAADRWFSSRVIDQ